MFLSRPSGQPPLPSRPPLPVRPSGIPETVQYVIVNKIILNNHQILLFRSSTGIHVENGEYWYDKKSGLWGSVGGPAIGSIDPQLPFDGDISGSWASGTGSQVWINGREIHWMELSQFPIPSKDPGSKYIINEEGTIIPDTPINQEIILEGFGKTLKVSVALSIQPRFSAAAKVVQNIQKWRMGGEQIVEVVKVRLTFEESVWEFSETLEAFSRLHQYIKKHYQSLNLPKFPGKAVGKKRTTDRIVKRQEKLEAYLQFIFSLRSIRENVRALCIVGLYDPIILPSDNRFGKLPLFGIGANAENPFTLLVQEQRLYIASFYIVLAQKMEWGGHKLLEVMMDRLLLPSSHVEHQISTIPCQDQFLIENYCPTSLTESLRWSMIWELFVHALKSGELDSRVHVSLQYAAFLLGIPLENLMKMERECATFLHEKLQEKENPNADVGKSSSRNIKLAAGAVVGGGILFAAGLVAAPLIIPAVVGGAAFLAGAIPLLGLGAAVTAGSSILAVVATPTLPLLFGAAGVGLGSYKAHRLTEGIKEFAFVPIPTFKCKEDGTRLDDEEEDISEPWDINWDTGEVVCTRQLDDSLETNLATVPTPLDPPLHTRRTPISSGRELYPRGTPPPINRDSKSKTLPEALLFPSVPSYHPQSTLVHSQSLLVPNRSLPLPPPSRPLPLPCTKPHKTSPKPTTSLQTYPHSQSQPQLKRSSPSLSKRAGSIKTKAQSTLRGSVRAVSDFEVFDYKPKEDHSHVGMRVCICVNGWVWNKQEFTTNWVAIRHLDPSLECYGLRWESEALQQLGRGLVKMMTQSLALQLAKLWIISMSAVAAGIVAAFAWPATAIAAASVLDNPWSIVATKAKKAGKLLGSALLSRAQGKRPVTLIGMSIGARVVFSALQFLADQGEAGKGIVENVYFLGAACTMNPKKWFHIRSVVAGRLVNGYTKGDWILGFVHRAAGTSLKVSGLGSVECIGVENVDLSSIVTGHLSYKNNLPKILEYLQIQDSNYSVPPPPPPRTTQTPLQTQDYPPVQSYSQEPIPQDYINSSTKFQTSGYMEH